MDISLFNDLYNIIKIPSIFELEEMEFFFFLLGGYSETDLYDAEKIKALFEKYKSEPYLSLPSLLGRKYSRSLTFHTKQKFTLNDLIKIHYTKNSPQTKKVKEAILNKKDEIYRLYKKFHISIPNENTEPLLLRLFSVCFTGQIPKLFASYNNQKLKPATIKTTLGRNDDRNELCKIIEQRHKVIISGEFGIGKTHFIKYCLSTWERSDYCYICYETDIHNTLYKIRYADINGYEYSTASDSSLFNKQFTSSLLVIDNMSYSENFYDDLEYLGKMPINIIIITTASIPENPFHSFWHYKLPLLPDDNLYKIFENNSGLSLENVKLKMTLSRHTLNNPLLVSLIAFQCKKLSNNTIAPLNNDSVIETVLSKLKYLNKHMYFASSNSKTFKHQYTQKTLDLLGHIKYVYDIIWSSPKENKSFKEFMKQLCVFGWSPIPTKFVEQVLPSYDNKILMELTKIGLITVVGEYIQISSLISHAFFATESLSPIAYKEMVSNLSKFLFEYDQTLDVPYLSDTLLIFFMSLYNDIPTQNNPRQSITADYFEDWQQLGYLIIEYYNHNSSCDLAQKLMELIKYPEHLKNRHNAFDKLLIDFSNKIQEENESDNMLSYIESLLHTFDNISETNKQLLPSNLYYSSNIDMTAFILNTLDTTLNQLCVLLIEQPNHNINCSIYIRIFVLHRLLQIIDSYRYHISIPLSKEQSCFYYGCCWLIMQNNISKDELEEILRIIDAWNNINYRIRGLAFIIFWASNLANDNQYKDLFTDLIKPNMEKLGHLIQNCKLIPEQTFRLCFYAYIKAATVQYVFMQKGDLSELESPNILNREILHFLFSRCNLTKKDYDELIKCVDSVFPDCINL